MHRAVPALMLLMLVLAGMPALPPTAGALSVPVADTLVIEGDHQYVGGVFVFTQPIVVAPGGSLTFRDATVYFDADRGCDAAAGVEYCPASILVSPGARLTVKRSTLDTRLPLADRWTTYVHIRTAGGVLQFEDSTVQHVLRVAVLGAALAPSTFTNTTFRDGATGISAGKAARIEVRNSVFEDLFEGVSFDDASGLLHGNRFSRLPNFAVWLQSTAVGEKALPSPLSVVGNHFEDNRVHLITTINYPILIENNRFERAGIRAVTVGMNMGDQALNLATPRILGNRFLDNPENILLYMNTAGRRFEQAQTVNVEGNSFEGKRCKDLQTSFFQDTVRVHVDATLNWWGSPEGPQDHGPGCPALSGHGIRVDPWLTEAP
ncbi:MAG TPA: right-handed parallel beta-helix repeat-containing protein [Candidatus Thermoplasmatota archaeon]|nr:right-handed parallel beta-helix repeat-containing protein [Candidatus Thermoplasmatota archaeon]